MMVFTYNPQALVGDIELSLDITGFLDRPADTDVIKITGAGNGLKLGKADTGNYVWLARWPDNVEYYSGSVQTTGAERVYFACPLQYSDLTADGKSIFESIVVIKSFFY